VRVTELGLTFAGGLADLKESAPTGVVAASYASSSSSAACPWRFLRQSRRGVRPAAAYLLLFQHVVIQLEIRIRSSVYKSPSQVWPGRSL
jgi:hypothetical protein